MAFGRLGGGLVLATCALIIVAAGIAATGGAVGVGAAGVGGALVTAAIACLAGGTALVALAPPPELRGRTIRAGLAVLAVGLGILVPSSGARMEDLLIYGLIAGAGIAWVGAIATLVGLLWRAGPARRHGAIVVLGLVLGGIGAGLVRAVGPLGSAVAIGGVLLSVGAIASLGVLAARPSRAAEPFGGA